MGAARQTYHALRHMKAYRTHIGTVTSAASGQVSKPRLRTAVRIAAMGTHAMRYNVSRCRLSRIGCTLVENGDAAHDRRSVNHKPLSAPTDSSGAILVASENGRKARLDSPTRGHLDLEASHEREDIQHGFFFLNLSVAKIEFAPAHDCSQVSPAELL